MHIHHRKSKLIDLDLYFEWTNDPITRSNSFNTQEVDYKEHTNWFSKIIKDKRALLLVFENEGNIPVGQIIIEQKTYENIIGISIDKNFRGLGLAVPMLTRACEIFFIEFQAINIHAYIKKTNLASLNSFKKAGFEIINEQVISNEASYLLEKKYV